MTRESREYFEIKFEAQLEFLGGELDDVVDLAGKDGGIQDPEFVLEVGKLRLRLAEAARMMSQLKAASSLAWPYLKSEMEQILFQIATSIKVFLADKNAIGAKKSQLEC